jgi:hypothetical protein
MIALLIIIAAVGSSYALRGTSNTHVNQNPVDPVGSLIAFVYFDQGSYKDYAATFSNAEWVSSKEEIAAYKAKIAEDREFYTFFGQDDTLEQVLARLAVEPQTEHSARVYYREGADARQETRWDVIRTDEKGWVIDNH